MVAVSVCEATGLNSVVAQLVAPQPNFVIRAGNRGYLCILGRLLGMAYIQLRENRACSCALVPEVMLVQRLFHPRCKVVLDVEGRAPKLALLADR